MFRDAEEFGPAADDSILPELRRRLEMIPAAVIEFERLTKSRPQARSQMAADDEASAWMQISHMVAHCMSMSIDNLRSIHALVLPTPERLVLPQYAHYPMLRAALESSSQALWIVEPAAQQERVRRLLQVRVSEIKHDWDLAKATTHVAGLSTSAPTSTVDRVRQSMRMTHDQHIAATKRIAARNGIDFDDIRHGRPGYAEIIDQAMTHMGDLALAGSAVWRVISGLSHPSMSRAAHFSELDLLQQHDNGVNSVLLTSNASWFYTALVAALAQFSEVNRIVRTRMLTPASERVPG